MSNWENMNFFYDLMIHSKMNYTIEFRFQFSGSDSDSIQELLQLSKKYIPLTNNTYE